MGADPPPPPPPPAAADAVEDAAADLVEGAADDVEPAAALDRGGAFEATLGSSRYSEGMTTSMLSSCGRSSREFVNASAIALLARDYADPLNATDHSHQNIKYSHWHITRITGTSRVSCAAL